MAHQSYVPKTNQGIGDMLTAFSVNIAADGNALAIKYGVSDADVTRVYQAHLVWNWFEDALVIARSWVPSLTAARDTLYTGVPGTTDPLPTPPTLPPVPVVTTVPLATPAVIEHDFFTFFGALVAGIKRNVHYDKADGILLGIEGTPVPPPNPTIVPVAQAEIFTSGHPEVSCVKGVFQGFDVYLTRPGAARRMIGTSLGRRFMVNEPLPAAGTAEVWVFEVQYRYKNAAFGLFSAPVSLTVRGV